ncbi:hypothetical protein ACA910_013515 [Epithemia clementina (nom. ined.)]
MTTVVHRQYLRVKRPLNATAPATLRLEGLQEGSHAAKSTTCSLAFSSLSISQHSNDDNDTNTTQNDSNSRKRPTTAVLKRVTDVGQELFFSPTASQTSCTQIYRVVEAILAEDENEIVSAGNKRRRLTLVSSKTLSDHRSFEQLFRNTQGENATDDTGKKKKKKPLRVLNPLERMVDESLKQVYQGGISPRQHYEYVCNNESLCSRRRYWLAWNNVEMGNLLHACALWNDSELTAELLSDKQQQDNTRFATQTDGDGRTPYQIAQLMGHESVSKVLEAFGADVTNYAYDLYSLDIVEDATGMHLSNSNNENRHPKTMEEEEDLHCDLQGGYGYWDEEGRLMLEAIDNHLLEHDAFEKLDGSNDDVDEDSNDEGFVGNDYPDEDEVNWSTTRDGPSDDDDNDDVEDDDFEIGQQDNTFRRAPVDLGDEDFDAAYGIYGQTEP